MFLGGPTYTILCVCVVVLSCVARATLTLEFEGDKPSDAEVEQIVAAANKKIAEDVPVQSCKMERKAAEAKYAKGVNSTLLYDKFPVPDTVLELVRRCLLFECQLPCSAFMLLPVVFCFGMPRSLYRVLWKSQTGMSIVVLVSIAKLPVS